MSNPWGNMDSKAGTRASDPHSANRSLSMLNTKGGAMIMKSVSIFLASGRRASTAQPKSSKQQETKKKEKKLKMDDINGKFNPKLIEHFKRKSHFSR